MRPTDENQSPSRRPNLISSQRRGSGEINILAMLEGQTGRPLGRRLAALPRALWYGCAGALAIALVGTVAWLAHDAGTPVPTQEAQAVPPTPPAETPEPMTAAVPDAPADMAPAEATAPDAALNVAAADPEMAALPSALPDPAVSTPIPAPVPEPVEAAVAPARPRHADVRAAARVMAPAPKDSPHRGTRATAAAHGPAAARTRRPASAVKPRPAAAQIDTDVALIAAIIQHSNAHPAAAADACGGHGCTSLPDQP